MCKSISNCRQWIKTVVNKSLKEAKLGVAKQGLSQMRSYN
jgi:hypothetical protein